MKSDINTHFSTINRQNLKAAVFGIALSSQLHDCAKNILAIQIGLGGGEQLFVVPNDLNPCPPQKPSAPSSSVLNQLV